MSSSHERSFSVAKTLAKLLSVPENRSCADCRSALVDASQVHASFSPPVGGEGPSISNFKLNHANYAPHGTRSLVVDSDQQDDDPSSADPCVRAASLAGGHGVFVCSLCGAAHKLLGSDCAVVYAVHNSFDWTPGEVRCLVSAGGNARSTAVFERYLPEAWAAKRPRADSNIADRLSFIRAKYEALAFVLPPDGPLAVGAWQNILNRHEEWNGLWDDVDNNADFTSSEGGTTGSNNLATADHQQNMRGSMSSVVTQGTLSSDPPERLVEYFCVVGPSNYLDPSLVDTDLSKLKSPDDVLLTPKVVDCFPAPDSHEGTEFPEHVSTFVMPEGCRPTTSSCPPSFFTFVLTSSSGDLLYGGALRLYDDDRDTVILRDVLHNSGYSGELPPFLRDAPMTRRPSRPNTASTTTTTSSSDVIYLPKCLVILSHYPFFDLWRKFLLQIYRIVLVEAPLPVERFIANFVAEIPLPPPGKIQVRCGFTVNNTYVIQRPPENQLPLANFSFQPLFASLSVTNVLVVFACLLQETRVALLSKHYALLTPVAEAFMSFLFPFRWEGLYLPVMPYRMLDILEAPVPYLVGLHSRYLVETSIQDRPPGVVFVDLDRDVVHLGFDDDNSKTPRLPPSLPEREAIKLKAKLDEFGAGVYVMTASGKVGAITSGKDRALMYSQRPVYAHVTNLDPNPSNGRRRDVFGSTERAYRENELLYPISGFLTEHGQFYEKDKSGSSPARTKSNNKFPFLRPKRNQSFDSGEGEARVHQHHQCSLLELDEPTGFSTSEIRNAFLRFFVSLFRDYRQYFDREKFRSAEFLANLTASVNSIEFVLKLLKSQLFERFLEIRRENPEAGEVMFFDESIIAKMNRSKRALTHGRKDTAFLDDKSAEVTENFTPPPPSNWGLPDDGRCYQYGKFPALNPELFGKIRTPRQWPQNRHGSSRLMRRSSIVTNDHVMKKAILSTAKRGVKNLESAIGVLSAPFAAPVILIRDSLGSDKSSRNCHREEGRRNTLAHDPSFRRKQLVKNIVRRSLANSDVTLPSVWDAGADKSAAQDIVQNSRRKQAILMGIIIRIQACIRIWQARLQVRRMRREQSRRSTLTISQSIRMNRQRTAARTMQSCYRGHRIRSYVRRLRRTTVVCQSCFRGRRVRFACHLLLRAIAKPQAYVRGYLTRRRLAVVLKGRMSTYRQQIFMFWRQANTPLCYRTKFWQLIRLDSFLRVRLAEAELQRLWTQCTITPPSHKEYQGAELNEALRNGVRLGMTNRFYWRSLRVEAKVAAEGFPVGGKKKEIVKRPSILTSASSSCVTDVPATRVAAERMQIYDRLSMPSFANTNHEHLLEAFVCFDIPVKEKRKKFHLAEMIWSSYENADASARFMLQLFPELESSTNIVFIEPSKKGVRRFRVKGSERNPEPLEKNLWAHALLSERIQRNVSEVAALSLLRVPSLTVRCSAIDERRRQIENCRQREAIMSIGGFDDWPRCRLEIMRYYFCGDMVPLAREQRNPCPPVTEGLKSPPTTNPFGNSTDEQKVQLSPEAIGTNPSAKLISPATNTFAESNAESTNPFATSSLEMTSPSAKSSSEETSPFTKSSSEGRSPFTSSEETSPITKSSSEEETNPFSKSYSRDEETHPLNSSNNVAFPEIMELSASTGVEQSQLPVSAHETNPFAISAEPRETNPFAS